MQTVAGKTGTCIGEGSWLGLFTSYAPLVSPRLAVVVIARGSDGRKHLPAAVAGQNYRDLNGRFGTPLNLQFATAPTAADDKAAALNEERRIPKLKKPQKMEAPQTIRLIRLPPTRKRPATRRPQQLLRNAILPSNPLRELQSNADRCQSKGDRPKLRRMKNPNRKLLL